MSFLADLPAKLELAKATAQKRANKTGLVQYVGMRYDCKLYVSKVKPSEGWLEATVPPQTKGDEMHS